MNTNPSKSVATASSSGMIPTPRSALRDVLRTWQPAAGPEGFEGLVANALATLSGKTFRLARSGTQFGRDAATPNAPFSIAMEAKRYTDTVPLENLAGKATVAALTLSGSIDLWVLAATVEVSEPTQRHLNDILEAQGITLLTCDWTDTNLPVLAVLLAGASAHILPWARTRLSPDAYTALECGLVEMAGAPTFAAEYESLVGQLSPSLLGLDALRGRNRAWCEERLRKQAVGTA